jgi:DNA-binding PadR family transcriptional regulator
MDVRTICLGILTRGDATGYEIKKLFEDGRYRFFVEASFGSIYPALSRLSEEGLVRVREETQTGRPDRKVYSITTQGRRAFLDYLEKPLPEDRFRSPFLFAMTFSDLLPETRIEDLIDNHIAQAEHKLAELEKDCSHSSRGESFACEFGRAMYATMLQYLRRRRKEYKTAVLNAAE